MDPRRVPKVALSGRQPWWWAILEREKRIENRRWWTSYRGSFLLHAAKGATRLEVVEATDWMMAKGLMQYEDWPGLEQVERGGFCGMARIVGAVNREGVVIDAENGSTKDLDKYLEWHMKGQYGYILASVRRLPFIPFKGALGLFPVPDEVREEYARVLADETIAKHKLVTTGPKAHAFGQVSFLDKEDP